MSRFTEENGWIAVSTSMPELILAGRVMREMNGVESASEAMKLWEEGHLAAAFAAVAINAIRYQVNGRRVFYTSWNNDGAFELTGSPQKVAFRDYLISGIVS